MIIIEAMAQPEPCCSSAKCRTVKQAALYFTRIDEAKFRKPVVPGDQLRIEVEVLKFKMGYAGCAQRPLSRGSLSRKP